MSTSENKAVLRRWFDAWNTRSVSALEALVDETFTADFVLHDKAQPAAAVGQEGVKQFVRDVLRNTPDIRVTSEDMIAEGDRIAMRYTVASTDASTGKSTRLLNIDIYRFANGKIAEVWGIDVPTQAQT
jgi:ketosteroid isomerase-like protein